MCDYKNGKIYQIVCNDTDEIYIGSTVQDLEDRLTHHKKPTNDCCSKQIIDRGNFYIEILETYPCNSQFELEQKEGEYQRANECINIRINGRTRKEWLQDNKEAIAKNKHEYYQNNKEAIAKNKREYYQNNKEHNKEYRQNNKEAIAKKKHEYYQNNKEAINAINNARCGKVVICECGIKSTQGNLKRHKLTKRHIDLMANL